MRDISITTRPRATSRLLRIATIATTAVTPLVAVLATTACTAADAQPSAARTPTAPSAAASSTPPTASNAPDNGTLIAFAWVTPRAVLPMVPPNTKLTPLETAASSRDGHTLYLSVLLNGGKCGTYDVVLERMNGQMHAGVIHRTDSKQACSTQKTDVTITVGTATLVGMKPVVDLATGQPIVAIAD